MKMKKAVKQTAQLLLVPLFILWICGCAVGPDFKVPDAPSVDRYTRSELPEKTIVSDTKGGIEQKFMIGRDINREWWTLFHSDALDGLIRKALQENPSVTLAEARLRAARENRAAQFGSFFPSVDAGASIGRQRISAASMGQSGADGTTFSLLNASIGVSYTLDVFGGLRRQLEALDAQVEYQSYQLEGAYLILTSNIITSALLEASLRKQVRATREIIDFQTQQLKLVKERYDLGAVALADVLAQQSQLAQSEAVLPSLEKNLSLVRHQLAVLIGKTPGEIDLPEFDFETMSLPEELPVSLPSTLVRQRPDIKAAEAVLHQACAQVGVATANLYPKITLSGAYGVVSNSLGDLFNSQAIIWNIGAGLLQPVFHGGTLRAQRRAAIAVYDQSLAQYRLTILQSFQNVADALRSLEIDAVALNAQVKAEQAARGSLDLTRKQYELGAVSYPLLLNAQQQYQVAYINLVQAQSARFADTAALFVALGGGWWQDRNDRKDASQFSQE